MAKPIIPLRPKEDNLVIPKSDKDLLTYYVLFGCDNQTAFLRFHPEFDDGKGKLNTAGKKDCRQFFSYARNKEYLDAYRTTLIEYGTGVEDDNIEDMSDERKNRALSMLLHNAMRIVETNSKLTPDELKTVSEIFKKVGLLKDENGKQIEAPRRYLPERCYAECQYRRFVEEAMENGDIVSDCDFCKTRKFAESHGWKFDPTSNLELKIEGK